MDARSETCRPGNVSFSCGAIFSPTQTDMRNDLKGSGPCRPTRTFVPNNPVSVGWVDAKFTGVLQLYSIFYFN